MKAPERGAVKKSYIREKRIYCGPHFLEVDIVPRTAAQDQAVKAKRGRKQNMTAPKQKNLNDKNSRRYFVQLGNANFGEDDLAVHITYAPKYKPKTEAEADREARNFLRRVAYERKKQGLPPLKYILVTEIGQRGRIHHHIIMNGGLDRDTVESLWRKPRKKGQKQGERIGYANADRLQPDEYGIAALCNYLCKNPQSKKRWSSSQNLIKPECRKNDHKYSRKKVARIARNPDDRAYWEKRYPGYTFTDCKPEYNEVTGWSLYVRMRRDC